MNVERLHSIARELREELVETETPSLVTQLIQALQQQAQDPGQVSYQQQVRTLRAQLDSALQRARSNDFPATWRLTLEELGISDLLGRDLRDRIQSIFDQDEITPATVAEELTVISGRQTGLTGALDQVISAFDFFALGTEDLDPGEFEVGFLIPRQAVENGLKELGEEFVALDRILKPFLELASGTRPALEVRSISSSAFQALITSLPAMALLVAKALESLVTTYEKILNIRAARQAMKEGGVPDQALDQVAEYVQGVMKKTIEELADSLTEEFRKRDEHRANELRTEVKNSLREMALRIDLGYSIDVRAGLPAPDQPNELDDDTRQAAETVASARTRLQFMNLSGSPILQLGTDDPANEPDEEAGEAEGDEPPAEP